MPTPSPTAARARESSPLMVVVKVRLSAAVLPHDSGHVHRDSHSV